jgi:translocator assembly and maintenance protein 41
MKHGEHPHKIRNIVQGNQEQFDQLYSKHLKTRPYTIQLPHIILQDKSPKQNKNHYNALPAHLTTTITTLLQEQKRQAPNYADTEELTQLLNEGLRRIIRPVSIAQTKKGIYSAGLRKSFKYARAKLKKAKQA